MKPVRLAAVLTLGAMLAACVTKPSPAPSEPVVEPSPTATFTGVPRPPAYENWLDAPQTPGTWSYDRSDKGSSAVFGEPGSRAKFEIVCDPAANRITLARLGLIAAEGESMTIRTETLARDLPTDTADRTQPRTPSYLSASDRLLDAMALSKGRFVIEIADSPPLYLPSWAEVTRVIEDCR